MPGSTEDNAMSADSATPAPDGAGKRGGEPGAVPKFLTGYLAAIGGAVSAGVGGVIVSDLQHRQLVMFAALVVIAVAVATWSYVLPQRRRRRPEARARRAVPETAAQVKAAQPTPRGQGRVLSPAGASPVQASSSAPPPPGIASDLVPPASRAPAGTVSRWLRPIRVAAVVCALVAGTCALVAGTFFLGYWTLGNGFAHGLLWGLLALAGVVLLIGIAVLAWYVRRRPGGAWLHPGSRMAMAFVVTCLGLSAGGTLGRLDLAPPCPPPVEIPVLASQENLAAVQDSVTRFEQAEPALLHQSCYVADLTVYAARSDVDAEADLESGWDPSALSADGPRPGVWLPSSSEEVAAVNAHASPAAPRMAIAGSTGSSPLVIAVPNSLIRRDAIHGTQRQGNWGTVYGMLQGHGISLSVPNPGQSATGLLGITGAYGDLTSAEQRQIAASGSFPSDSGIMLCAAAQATEQEHRPSSAYLVSEAAVKLYNNGQLTEGACPTLTSRAPALTPLYPSGAASLDFPFVTLGWGGNSAMAQLAQRYEMDFYRWLGSPAGQQVQQSYFLGPPQPSVTLPSQSQVQDALQLFTQKAPPARILVAIDDSGPMEPYLQQIASAVTGVLGTGTTTSLGASDSFGVWAFPGAGTSTYRALVPFGSGANSQRDAVAASMSTLSAHAHSAEFDLIADAARVLYGQPAKAQQAISSVILLTDGDAYQKDPDGNTFVSVQATLHPLGVAKLPVRVFVIAFGDPGCDQSPPGSTQDTLTALATANGGNCVNVNDLGQQFGQLVSQLSAGG